MKPKPTVHIVDDDPDVIEALSDLVGTIGLTAETYQSAEEFLEKYKPTGPGCLVLDVRMPGRSGLHLQKEIAACGDGPPVIILTGHGDVSTAVEAMKRGAMDFIEKPVQPQRLCDLIQEAISRDEQVWRQREEEESVERRLARLTPAEREVLDLIAAGKTNKEIGQKLGLSVRGVEHRRAKLMATLEVKSRLELLEFVMPALRQ
jgi:RNA polymerase sigma factor (sigma-70 family)